MQTSFLRLLAQVQELRAEVRLLKLENNNLKGALMQERASFSAYEKRRQAPDNPSR